LLTAKADVNIAVQAAKNAFKLGSPWRRMDAIDRGYLLHKLADLMQRDAAHLAALESLDNGKPYHIALNVDVPGSIETLRFYFELSFKTFLFC
jgi:aldehyde dehydrogenase (NAD+)